MPARTPIVAVLVELLLQTPPVIQLVSAADVPTQTSGRAGNAHGAAVMFMVSVMKQAGVDGNV